MIQPDKKPLDFVCPRCNAAIGAKCLEKAQVSWLGHKPIDEPHIERKALTKKFNDEQEWKRQHGDPELTAEFFRSYLGL